MTSREKRGEMGSKSNTSAVDRSGTPKLKRKRYEARWLAWITDELDEDD